MNSQKNFFFGKKLANYQKWPTFGHFWYNPCYFKYKVRRKSEKCSPPWNFGKWFRSTFRKISFNFRQNRNRIGLFWDALSQFLENSLFEVGIDPTLLLMWVEIHFIELINHWLQILTFYLFRVWLLTVPFWTFSRLSRKTNGAWVTSNMKGSYFFLEKW